MNKFKRILKILVTDHFLMNEFYFLNKEKLPLYSQKQFDKELKSKFEPSLKTRFSLSNVKEQQELIENLNFWEGYSDFKTVFEGTKYMTSEVRSFCKIKRQWIKAFDILIEIAMLTLE